LRLRQLRRCHVDADDPTVRFRASRGEEAVGNRSAAEIEHNLAGRDGSQVEEVANARERGDGLAWNRVEISAGIAQSFGEAASGFEVELSFRSTSGCAACSSVSLAMTSATGSPEGRTAMG
jgi:hypothetical protein